MPADPTPAPSEAELPEVLRNFCALVGLDVPVSVQIEMREAIRAIARDLAAARAECERLRADRDALRAEVVFNSATFGLIAAPVEGNNQAIARHHAKRLGAITSQWPRMAGKAYKAALPAEPGEEREDASS